MIGRPSAVVRAATSVPAVLVDRAVLRVLDREGRVVPVDSEGQVVLADVSAAAVVFRVVLVDAEGLALLARTDALRLETPAGAADSSTATSHLSWTTRR